MLRFRPRKTSDGHGGYAVTLYNEVVIYGRLEVHKDLVLITDVDINEDVLVGDVLEVDE